MALKAYKTDGSLIGPLNKLMGTPVVGEIAAFDLKPDAGETYPGFVLPGVPHGQLSHNGVDFFAENTDLTAVDVLSTGERFWIRASSVDGEARSLVVPQGGMVPVSGLYGFDRGLGADSGELAIGVNLPNGFDAGIGFNSGAIAIGDPGIGSGSDSGLGADSGGIVQGIFAGNGTDAGLGADTGTIDVGGGAPTFADVDTLYASLSGLSTSSGSYVSNTDCRAGALESEADGGQWTSQHYMAVKVEVGTDAGGWTTLLDYNDTEFLAATETLGSGYSTIGPVTKTHTVPETNIATTDKLRVTYRARVRSAPTGAVNVSDYSTVMESAALNETVLGGDWDFVFYGRVENYDDYGFATTANTMVYVGSPSGAGSAHPSITYQAAT